MSTVEAFLDETPGETRGVVVRNGRFEHLLIHRDDDLPQQRLGARSIGRILQVETGLKGAFVDLGAGPPAFLPGGTLPPQGAAVEVEVSAEPRESKGAVVRLIGSATGEPRLIEGAPSLRESLAALCPGIVLQESVEAIRAGLAAEEEALSNGSGIEGAGLDLAVERTRALVAVDIDLAAKASTGRNARDRANARGLLEAARAIRLRRWGGLVAVDLVGTGHDGKAVLASARAAFGESAVYGPVNRFGVLMLTLPWGRTPIEEVTGASNSEARIRRTAQLAVRRLRLALLSERSQPTMTLSCGPQIAAIAGPWIEALGPRARMAVAQAGRSDSFELWTN